MRTGTEHEADDALALANLLIEEDPHGGSHWDNTASELLQALIIYMCRRHSDQPELRTLSTVKGPAALGLEVLIGALEDADMLGSRRRNGKAPSLREAGAEVHTIGAGTHDFR